MKYLFAVLLHITVVTFLLLSSVHADADTLLTEAEITQPSYEGFEWIPDEYTSIFIFRIDDGGVSRDVLSFAGPIVFNTTEIIRFFYNQYPEIDEIVLSSPGGLATEALELGSFFSNNSLKVTVPPGTICLSACAYAFLGGTDYRIDGVLGFHTAYLGSTEREISDTDIDTAHAVGQNIGNQFAIWFIRNGFSTYLFTQITNWTDKENFISFLHEDELLEWYVRDDDSEFDDILKYIYPIDMWDESSELVFIIPTEEPTIMTGDEVIDFLSENPNQNDRGRLVTDRLMLWPMPIDQ